MHLSRRCTFDMLFCFLLLCHTMVVANTGFAPPEFEPCYLTYNVLLDLPTSLSLKALPEE